MFKALPSLLFPISMKDVITIWLIYSALPTCLTCMQYARHLAIQCLIKIFYLILKYQSILFYIWETWSLKMKQLGEGQQAGKFQDEVSSSHSWLQTTSASPWYCVVSLWTLWPGTVAWDLAILLYSVNGRRGSFSFILLVHSRSFDSESP